MTYNKPQLTVLTHAVDAIQSGLSKLSSYRDNIDLNHPMNATSSAYEADE